MRCVALVLVLMLPQAARAQRTTRPIPILIATQLGDIEAELDSADAPVSSGGELD